MARRTSIEAYNKLRDEGLIGRRQFQVYDIVYHNGPLTANQAYNILAEKMGKTFRFDSNTRARFTELRDMGLLYECGTATDPVTKMNVILWDVTENLPNKSATDKPKKPNLTRIEILVNQLISEVNAIKSDLRVMKAKGQTELF